MKKTDAEIVDAIIKAFGVKNKSQLSKDLKYKNPNSINQIIRGDLSISESFIQRALNAYPNLNENFLRGTSLEVTVNDSKAIGQKNLNTFTLNDLPYLFYELIEKQTETIEILKSVLEELKKQGD